MIPSGNQKRQFVIVVNFYPALSRFRYCFTCPGYVRNGFLSWLGRIRTYDVSQGDKGSLTVDNPPSVDSVKKIQSFSTTNKRIPRFIDDFPMQPSICSGFPIATGEQWIQPRVWTSQLRRQDAYFSLVTLQQTPLLAAAEAGRFEVGWLRIRWSSLNPVNPYIIFRHMISIHIISIQYPYSRVILIKGIAWPLFTLPPMAIMETSTGSRSPSWGTIEAPGRPGSDVEVPWKKHVRNVTNMWTSGTSWPSLARQFRCWWRRKRMWITRTLRCNSSKQL